MEWLFFLAFYLSRMGESLHIVCLIGVFFYFTPCNSSSARLGQNSRASISSITKKASSSLISLLAAIVTSRENRCDAVLVHLRLLNWLVVNSPRGSVTTTVAEKQKLAKASLAFNCKIPTYRKLFPEYVKYEEQQLLVHSVQEQVSSVPTQAENSTPLLDGLNRAEPCKDVEIQRRKSLPTWLLLLLVSIFGVVMALLLLQL